MRIKPSFGFLRCYNLINTATYCLNILMKFGFILSGVKNQRRLNMLILSLKNEKSDMALCHTVGCSATGTY